MNIFNIFKKKKLDIEFVDTSRMIYQQAPIRLAKDEPIHFSEKQKKEHGKFMFPFCPGIYDYAKYGYILPAWEDFHIKANKAGTVAFIGGKRGNHVFHKPSRMGHKIVDGVFEPTDEVPLNAWKFDSPWGIFVNKNISCFLMPAIYHSTFLDDLYVYPGIVDYNNFHTINFIFSPKRECEVHINYGDPLLHILPFNNDSIKGGYGPGEDHQLDKFKNQIPHSENQYYRKNLSVKKEFKLGESKDG
jgi:hypothetical protein